MSVKNSDESSTTKSDKTATTSSPKNNGSAKNGRAQDDEQIAKANKYMRRSWEMIAQRKARDGDS